MGGNRSVLALGAAGVLLCALAVPVPVAATGPGPGGEPVQPVVVQLADSRDAAAVAADAGAEPAVGQAIPDVPVVALDVTEAGLQALQRDPRVEAILTRGTTVELAMAQSVPKVGAPGRHSAGFDGDGKVVAVIDTGVASSFGGTLVGQACFAATLTGPTLEGHCGVAADQEQAFDDACFAAGVCSAGATLDAQAGRPCPGAATSCQHGTAVAAVAARHDAPKGVAPDAGVYAVRVFNPAGSRADLVDIYLAIDHLIQMSDAGAFDLAAVNLSVGTDMTFTGDCRSAMDGPIFEFVFSELRARGIAPVVASGNDGNTTQLAFPACLPSAVSVGATDLDDDLASFGNRGAGLDLLAPGADEASVAVPVDDMEIPGNSVGSWSGTSFSAPHVAGAFALMAQEYPKASIAQLTSFLRSIGVPVSEAGRGYRRLLLRPPEEALAAQVLFPTSVPVTGAPRSAIGDLDGDGHADILGHAPGSAPDRIHFGGDSWSLTTRTYAVSGSYTPLVGNFRGTAGGPDDVIWYAPGSPADYLWIGQPSRTMAGAGLTVRGTYEPVVGDFDGDGFDDVLWYAAGSLPDALWYGGPSAFSAVPISVVGTYRVAVGDFDHDQRDDLVFHGPNSASDGLWRASATRGQWAKTTLAMGGSYTQRVGDFDGDGAADLLLYQPGGRTDSIWRGGPGVDGVGGTGGFSPLAITVSGTYQPVVGDVDGDALDDIVWYAPGAAGDYVWFRPASGTVLSRAISVAGTDYTPLIGDVDADDGDDIVWARNAGSTTPLWWSYTSP